MKKIILMVTMVVGVGLGWGESPKKAEQQGADGKGGQNDREQTKEERIKKVDEEMKKLKRMAEQKEEPQEVRDFVKNTLADIESNKNDSLKLNRAINKLKWQLSMYRNSKVHISLKTTQEMTKTLVKIFYSIDDVSTNGANKIHIIETIGFGDNSAEARQFFFSLMDNGPDKYRQHALWSLSPKGLHGEDVYNKIKELIKKGIVNRNDKIVLHSLKRAHSQNAIKDIQEVVANTNNLIEFNSAGVLLCDYDDTNLIDVLLKRVGEFKPTIYDKSTTAINRKLLRKYIENNEDEKLKTALKVYKQKGLDNETLPLMENKLNSKNPITREAVAEFLENRANEGSMSPTEAKKSFDILQRNIQKEKDENVKKKMKKSINSIEKRLK